MLIKILSMQRVINYGSFMQAFALKSILENQGHEVHFVDFNRGRPRHNGNKVSLPTILNKLVKIPKLLVSPSSVLKKRNFKRNMSHVFTKNAWPRLGIRPEASVDYSCDLFIIGSDEVFNYTQNHAFGYVPAFFGHGISAKTLISYAASAGYTDLDDIENDGMQDDLSTGFSKFDAISVRDKNTRDIVRAISDTNPKIVLDPTLIYDFDNEITQIRPPVRTADYLLIYAYTDRLDAKHEVKQILGYARSKNLKIVSVGFYHEWCDENLVVSPFELLGLFNYAVAIITDTFHGTIFSVINRKAFVCLLRQESNIGSNANKLEYLIQQIGLSSRINLNLSDLNRQFSIPINYSEVEARLAPLQEQSRLFLSMSLDFAARKGSNK